jgi:hypothetical protein
LLVYSAPCDSPLLQGQLGASFTVDARLAGIYADYSQAVEEEKKSLYFTSQTNLQNGIRISGTKNTTIYITPPKPNPDFQTVIVLFKYKKGAIKILNPVYFTPNSPSEYKAYSGSVVQFDQILSTFKFTN